MNLHYLMNELYYQKRRTVTAILGLSIGIALLIILNALSTAYRQAAHAPLKEIGADITVQRPGDVPKDLTGVVFPCSAVTIQDDQVKKIRGLDGVRGIGKAVLSRRFAPSRAWIVLGVEQQNSIGPAVLRSAVTEGRFLEPGKPEALVEMSYARQFGIKVGDTISMANTSFPVVGLVDASRAAKIAVANVYVPIEEAQKLAAASSQVQSVSPFRPADVNLLFIKADQEKITDLASALRNIVGKKATIGTPESFSSFSAASLPCPTSLPWPRPDRHHRRGPDRLQDHGGQHRGAGQGDRRPQGRGLDQPQRREPAPWRSRSSSASWPAFSVLSWPRSLAFGLSFMNVSIPIPWDMSPTPHFLPGGGDQVFKTLRLPVHIPWVLAGFGVLLSVVIGGVTGAMLGRTISRIKPSEVLRHE